MRVLTLDEVAGSLKDDFDGAFFVAATGSRGLDDLKGGDF